MGDTIMANHFGRRIGLLQIPPTRAAVHKVWLGAGLVGVLILGDVGVSRAAPPKRLPAAEERVFIPRAGYGRTALAAHLARRALERNSAMFAPGQQLSITGVRSVPVICVEFKNVAAPFPVASYQELLFGSEPTTMSAYYRDVSQGKLTVTGQVVGW
jgi:hypothetical protein